MSNSPPRAAAPDSARYALLLEAVGDAVVAIDAHHRISEFNKEAERIFGYPKTEILGQSIDVLLPEASRHAHGSHIANFAGESADRRLMRERAEVHGRRKDGGKFDAEVAITKIRIGDELHYMAVVRDISERKRLERNLSEGAHHLRQAQELAGLGSFEMDIRTGETVWSAQSYKILGLDPEARPLDLDLFLAMIHPDDRTLILARYDDAIAGRETTISADMRITRADGGERIILGVAEILRGIAGRPPRLIASLQDVTEQRAAADQVRLAKEGLQRAQELTNLGSWQWIPRTNALTWSDQMYRLLGVEPGSVTPSPESFASFVHPEDLERNEAFDFAPLIRAANFPDRPRGITEFRIVRPDGAERWVQGRVQPFPGPDGQIDRVEGTVQDITEQRLTAERLRRSEELLNKAQQLAKLGSWERDEVSGTLTWSRNFFAILGLDPDRHVPSGELIMSLIHPDDRAAVRERIEHARTNRVQLGSYDMRIVRADGTVRTLRNSLEYLWATDGSLLRVSGTSQDVTEQKADAERLRKSEHLLNRAQQLADLGSWEHDEATGEIVWSHNFFTLLRLNPDIHRPSNELFWAMLQPEDQAMVQARYREAIANRDQAATYYTRIVRGDGVARTLFNTVEYYWSPDHRLARVSGISQDVTEQLAASETLAQRERSLANAQRIARIGSWDWHIQADSLSWSPEIFRILGHPPDAFAPSYDAFGACVHPEDRDDYHSEFIAVLKGERSGDLHHRIVLPSGEVRIVHHQIEVVFAVDGNAVQLSGTVQDVTEQKTVADNFERSERMLAQAQQISKSGSWEIDLASGILRWSLGYYELMGLDPARHAPDAQLTLSLVHPDDRDVVAGVWQRTTAGDTSPEWIEYRIIRPDGDERPVRAVGGFVRDEAGRLTRIVGMVQDVTEQRAAERRLKAALEVAQAGNRAKSEFLANMSHELRTPLNAIIGFSELLSMGDSLSLSPEVQKEYLQDIYNSGQNLLEIINGILSLSKAESGETVLDEEIFEPPAVIAWIFRLVEERARTAGVDLSMIVEAQLPSLTADIRLIRQALLNLVSNAVKFCRPGGTVSVRLRRHDSGGMEIAVADSGIGMNPEDIVVALTPFGQVDSSLQRKYEGTGLGLPLARKFIQLHGGELTIDSVPGKGTTVTVVLPKSRCLVDAAA